MSLVLEVASGSMWGRRLRVDGVERLWVGGSERAQLTVRDGVMSGRHFALRWTGEHGTLETCENAWVELNGERITTGVLAHGDWIRAGETDFVVHYVGATFGADALEAVAADPMRRAALIALRRQPANLYAIVDGARHRRVRLLLSAATERWQALHQAPQAMTLADAAPYLVTLGPKSELLVQLVAEGWGESWGIYFVATRPFEKVWRAMRGLLTVRVEGMKGRAYFRFYDPRVLRTFLPTATERQRATILGAMGRVLSEDASGALQIYEGKLS